MFDLGIVVPSVLNGLTTGAVYALIALGLTLIYGVLHIINFAHGALLMVALAITPLRQLTGQPVLLRTAPPVATPTGQRLLNHLQQVRQMEATLGLEATSVTTVRLAVNADSLATWLPQALVMPDYPQLCFDFVVEDQSVGLKRMKQGDVMACLCASSQAVNGAKVQPLGALHFVRGLVRQKQWKVLLAAQSAHLLR